MSRALRAAAIGAALAAASLSATWGLLFYRPLPTIDGYYRLLGLHERAEVVRDVFGIPRLYARDRHDLLFLQGYVTAQDRLTQMDALRLSARAAVGSAGDAAVGRAPLAFREALDAYAAGVTKLIHQDADARVLPGEIVLSGRRPPDWTAADTLAIAAAYLERVEGASVCAAATSTRSGRPLLAADLYADIPPPGWYEIGIDGGDVRAVGVSLPGVPFVAAGHNGWVAWAVLASARPGSDPAATVGALMDATGARSASAFMAAMRTSAVATCAADIGAHAGASDRERASLLPAGRAAVLGSDSARTGGLADALASARGIDLAAMQALLGRPSGSVGARVIVDLADVDTSRSVVSHGASGHRSAPHFDDQVPLWEVGASHRLPYSRAAIGRVDGELTLRAR